MTKNTPFGIICMNSVSLFVFFVENSKFVNAWDEKVL